MLRTQIKLVMVLHSLHTGTHHLEDPAKPGATLQTPLFTNLLIKLPFSSMNLRHGAFKPKWYEIELPVKNRL